MGVDMRVTYTRVCVGLCMIIICIYIYSKIRLYRQPIADTSVCRYV